jgi:hypothetical protein
MKGQLKYPVNALVASRHGGVGLGAGRAFSLHYRMSMNKGLADVSNSKHWQWHLIISNVVDVLTGPVILYGKRRSEQRYKLPKRMMNDGAMNFHLRRRRPSRDEECLQFRVSGQIARTLIAF